MGTIHYHCTGFQSFRQVISINFLIQVNSSLTRYFISINTKLNKFLKNFRLLNNFTLTIPYNFFFIHNCNIYLPNYHKMHLREKQA